MATADPTPDDGIDTTWSADTNPASPASPEQTAPDAELRRGDVVGRYRILERLGVGGMGVVYRAHDPQLDREVALKLLRSARVANGEGSLRMLREAKSVAKIRHPNVVTVYDAGEVDGRVFIAMELMRGTDLGGWFDRQHAWREVVDVMLQAARGLRAAHEAGLIHRDFKPDNVVVEADGNVKVLDFGLARAAYDSETQSRVAEEIADHLAQTGVDGLQTLTHTGALVGTPAYMAPEQYLRGDLDARTDQFSFCVTLFMGVYGHRPFSGRTYGVLTMNVVNGIIEEPEDPSVAPARLLEVLRKGLAPNPANRFASMDMLIAELQAISSRDGGRRVPLWAVAAGLGVAAIVISTIVMLDHEESDDPPEEPTIGGPPEIPVPPSPISPELAKGEGQHEPVDGPQIWISIDTLRVLAKDGVPQSDIPLSAGDPLTLYVDHRTPHSTIIRTIEAGKQAGFARFDFAVQTDAGIRVFEVASQTPVTPVSGIALELDILPDRVRVGARRTADGERLRWPLDAGAGSCELPLTSLVSLGLLANGLCSLEAAGIPFILSAHDDVAWQQVVDVLDAAQQDAACSHAITIETSGREEMTDCATPLALPDLAAKLPAEFRRWCFINTSLRNKKECRPTQAACIAEAQHWVDNPRRSCRGEK